MCLAGASPATSVRQIRTGRAHGLQKPFCEWGRFPLAFATPVDNATLFTQSGTPVGGAGAVDNTSTAAREIQFALKLIW